MLAYGHYPLEVIAHSSFLPIRPEQHVLGATHLRTVLARHGVSTYVAGHLHAAFGSKLHRMHAYPGKQESDPQSASCLPFPLSISPLPLAAEHLHAFSGSQLHRMDMF